MRHGLGAPVRQQSVEARRDREGARVEGEAPVQAGEHLRGDEDLCAGRTDASKLWRPYWDFTGWKFSLLFGNFLGDALGYLQRLEPTSSTRKYCLLCSYK